MRVWLKSSRVLAMSIGILGCVSVAHAGPITSFTVSGTGGASAPVSGLSDQPFMWADYTGGVSGASTLAAYGFNPTPGFPSLLDASVGSFLLSSTFDMNDGDVLTVDMSIFTANADKDHFGFALLIEDSTLRAVLANIRADGETTPIDMPHPEDWNFVPPSPGVATSVQTLGIGEMPVFTLGGAEYGTRNDPSYCGGGSLPGCQTNVNSSFAPGAGTYQLLFGVLSWGGGTDATKPTGIAVSASVEEPARLGIASLAPVSVPEPSALPLFGCGLLGLAIARTLRRPRPARVVASRLTIR